MRNHPVAVPVAVAAAAFVAMSFVWEPWPEPGERVYVKADRCMGVVVTSEISGAWVRIRIPKLGRNVYQTIWLRWCEFDRLGEGVYVPPSVWVRERVDD